MKTLILSLLLMSPLAEASCPEPQTDALLRVLSFSPSADARSSKGICTVEAVQYSWWETDAPGPAPLPSTTYLHPVEGVLCDSKYFVQNGDRTEISATLSYSFERVLAASLDYYCYCTPQVTFPIQ